MTKPIYTANWKKLDPEAKLGLPAKRFTGVNAVWALFCGIILTLVFYAALLPLWNMKSSTCSSTAGRKTAASSRTSRCY